MSAQPGTAGKETGDIAYTHCLAQLVEEQRDLDRLVVAVHAAVSATDGMTEDD